MVRKGREAPDPKVPIVIISGHTEEYRIREAAQAGIQEYVVKPFSPEQLVRHVTRALNVPPSVLEMAS